MLSLWASIGPALTPAAVCITSHLSSSLGHNKEKGHIVSRNKTDYFNPKPPALPCHHNNSQFLTECLTIFKEVEIAGHLFMITA